MSWWNVGVAAVGVAGSISGSNKQAKAAKEAGAAAESQGKNQLKIAREAEKLNRERYRQGQYYLNPYMERELQASNQLLFELGLTPYEGTPDRYGTKGNLNSDPKLNDMFQVRNIQPERRRAYMESEGYQDAMSAYDAIEQEGIDAVNQGAANSGNLYSGSRGEALRDVGGDVQLARAGTEMQFYNNYLNMLQGLATPQSTTNLSSLGLNQAATIGTQNIAAQQNASNTILDGVYASTAAQNAATADKYGGVADIASAYIGSLGREEPGVPIDYNKAVDTGGTITPAYI